MIGRAAEGFFTVVLKQANKYFFSIVGCMVLEQRLLSILLHWINSQVAVQPNARYFYKIDLRKG